MSGFARRREDDPMVMAPPGGGAEMPSVGPGPGPEAAPMPNFAPQPMAPDDLYRLMPQGLDGRSYNQMSPEEQQGLDRQRMPDPDLSQEPAYFNMGGENLGALNKIWEGVARAAPMHHRSPLNPLNAASAAIQLPFNLMGTTLEDQVPFQTGDLMQRQADQFYKSNAWGLDAADKVGQAAMGLPITQGPASAMRLGTEGLKNAFQYARNVPRAESMQKSLNAHRGRVSESQAGEKADFMAAQARRQEELARPALPSPEMAGAQKRPGGGFYAKEYSPQATADPAALRKEGMTLEVGNRRAARTAEARMKSQADAANKRAELEPKVKSEAQRERISKDISEIVTNVSKNGESEGLLKALDTYVGMSGASPREVAQALRTAGLKAPINWANHQARGDKGGFAKGFENPRQTAIVEEFRKLNSAAAGNDRVKKKIQELSSKPWKYVKPDD